MSPTRALIQSLCPGGLPEILAAAHAGSEGLLLAGALHS